jgi:YVTN family beta-propeller protein
LIIAIFALLVLLSKDSSAQDPDIYLPNRTIYEIVKQTSGSHNTSQVEVGNLPSALVVDTESNNVYVANSGSDTVSVIHGENNTKRGEDIAVGDIPQADRIDRPTDMVLQDYVYDDISELYIANSDSDTDSDTDSDMLTDGSVSVITTNYANNTNTVSEIPVGGEPRDIEFFGGDMILVATTDFSGVSVITINSTYDEENQNYTWTVEDTTEIDVGGDPSDIVVFTPEEDTDNYSVYVASENLRNVSVITGNYNEENQNYTWTVEEEIPVGVDPLDMELIGDELLVTNKGSNSVSVLTTGYENDRSTVKGITEVLVGEAPRIIEVAEIDVAQSGDEPRLEPIVFVNNRGSDTVSVLSRNYDEENQNYTWIEEEEIPVGDAPTDIIVDNYAVDNVNETKVYVANYNSDTVSVITPNYNEENQNYTWTEEEEIPVGDGPIAMDYNPDLGTVYVANELSGGVSVIDSEANEVLAGVTFQVNPFNSGYILCDNLTTPSPVGQYVYVYSGAECIAKPNEGFEFVSWEENLGGNATQHIQVSRDASNWDSFVLAVADFFGDKPDEPESKLNVTKFGTFTANFKEAPPPLPQEFWAQMSVVIVTVITGLFIPSIVGWFKSKREAKKLKYFHNEIDALYQDGKLDEKDIKELDDLRNRIENAYPEGKLNEKHYESLSGKISVLYDKIFKKRINDLSNNATENETRKGRLDVIRKDLGDAYSEGKLNEKHYNLLNEDISKLDGKEGNNKPPKNM